MKLKVFAAASSVALAAAFAAAPAAAQPIDWSGFYLGAQAGYLWGDTDHAFDNGAPSDTSNISGVVLGAHLGWNHQTPGGFVFGIEGDGEWTSADGGFDNVTGITSSGSADLNWQASARARLGIASGSWLTYATGGGAFGNYDFGGGPSPFPPCCGFSSTEIGWTVGGGIEKMFPGNVSAGVEYRFTDYGSETAGLPPGFPGVLMTVDSTTHAVRARLSFHF